MFGNRTICGIGRGDSAVRVANGKPTTLATLRDSLLPQLISGELRVKEAVNQIEAAQ